MSLVIKFFTTFMFRTDVELSSLTEGWRSMRDSFVTMNNDKCYKHILDHYLLNTKINSRGLMKSMETPEGIPNSWSLSVQKTLLQH